MSRVLKTGENQITQKYSSSHKGVDVVKKPGSLDSVIAHTAGTVILMASGKKNDTKATGTATYGNYVKLDHGNGYETSYSHLSKINVRKGQRVSRGEIIALSGDTGLSLSPHLHYEVRLNGMRVDPIHYFFMELTPTEYQRLMRIAQSGMQSFD